MDKASQTCGPTHYACQCFLARLEAAEARLRAAERVVGAARIELEPLPAKCDCKCCSTVDWDVTLKRRGLEIALAAYDEATKEPTKEDR